MESIHQKQNLSLIWGSLRNLIDFSTIKIPSQFSLRGSKPGIFPVDSYNPIYLEIPKDDKKLDLSGRKNLYFGNRTNPDRWKERRIVRLPIYQEDQEVDLDKLKNILYSWHLEYIPVEIPPIAVGSVIKGDISSEGRLGQYSVVMLVWSNFTARILELDWFEGPLDDCITPEWYIRTSELMSFELAIDTMMKLHENSPHLTNPLHSLYSIPSNLDIGFAGDEKKYRNEFWKNEIDYYDFQTFQNDLHSLLNHLKKLSL